MANDASSSESLPRTFALLRDGMSNGLHIGAQVYVSLNGKTVANFALGESLPGVAMTPDTLMLWLSASKPVAAVAIAQLMQRGSVGLDDPVAHVIPEFAANGKQAVTVRHILTHTAGFRFVDTGRPETSWEEILQRLCAAPLERGWTPGKRAGYHATTSWFILGEIVRRLDGRPYEMYVRDEIFEPLGMTDSWIGMPAERYRAYGERLGVMYATDKSLIRPLPPYDTERAITHCRPAANGQGPAHELGRFYQMLLNGGELDGRRLLRPETVRLCTTPQRIGMFDETFRHIIDWGLGFIINSAKYGPDTVPYGFGPHASPATFGHNGFQSSIAFADPEHELAVVIIPNGTPGEAAHDRRLRAVLAAVYEDLRLARG